ncbi:hypothetical protein PENSPDRAFT_685375 [Peniophora sp. CONT]|nr:hypothetical protein PENSPDRAFT_685375 [Peniophora sp. CONT]
MVYELTSGMFRIGPILIGQDIGWLLLGTLAVQLYIFEKNRQNTNEAIWIRYLGELWTIFALETAQAILATQLLWRDTILVWGDVSSLNIIHWTATMVPIFDGTMTLIVQVFYAWRIWILTHTRTIRILACLVVVASMTIYLSPDPRLIGRFQLSLTQFGAAIPASVLILVARGYPSVPPSVGACVEIWLVGSFTGDLVIAGCMIYVLFRARSRTLWDQSQALYDRLIVNVVQTGLLTTIVAAATLALWKGWFSKAYYTGAGMILGKVYSNSLLSTLNGRVFRHDEPWHDHGHSSLRDGRPNIHGFWRTKRQRAGNGLGVLGLHMNREHHVDQASAGRLSFAVRSDEISQDNSSLVEGNWEASDCIGGMNGARKQVLELTSMPAALTKSDNELEFSAV